MKHHRIHSKHPVVPIESQNLMRHSEFHLFEKWLLVRDYAFVCRPITYSLDTIISTRIDLAPNPQLDPLLGICCTSFEDQSKIYQTLIMVDPVRALIEKTKPSNNENDRDTDKKEVRYRHREYAVEKGIPKRKVEDRISHLHDHVQNCIDEKSLLMKFAKHISKVDPDILICWDEKDTLRYIIQRSLVHG